MRLLCSGLAAVGWLLSLPALLCLCHATAAASASASAAAAAATTTTATGLAVSTVTLRLSAVSSSAKSPAPPSISLAFPESLSAPLPLDAAHTLHVAFAVTAASPPHQVVLALKHSSLLGTAWVAPCTSPAKPTGKYECIVKTSDAPAPGSYSLTILVGAFGTAAPFEYVLGSATLDLAVQPRTPPHVPRTVPVLAMRPLPAIHHAFRPAQLMPSPALSKLFTALVLVPWLLLLALWAAAKVNLGNFSTDPLPLLYNSLFLVSLAAICALYYFYWSFLNIFETLGALALLSLPSSLFGKLALSHRAQSRKNA